MAVASLYTPLRHQIHFWPKVFGRGYVVSDGGRVETEIDVSIVDYGAVISVNATAVLYSVAGDYVAVLVATTDDYNSTFPFSIVVHGIYSFIIHKKIPCLSRCIDKVVYFL